jgi:hypothetical protein
MIHVHKCEQCDDAKFHGREWCDLHTKKPAPKPDPIFAHHSVVKESSAPKKCSIEGCEGSLTYPGGLELPAFYCWAHDRVYLSEWQYCQEDGCYQWTPAVAEYCAKHRGQDYTPRTTESSATTGNYKREGWTYCGVCDQILPHMERCIPRRAADHPNPAPPEVKPCDDGKKESTPEPQSGLDDVIAVYGDLLFAGIEAAAGLQIWLWEALSSTGVAALKESIGALRNEINKPDTGVLPLEPLTPEERAQDLVRWRRDIQEHNREKEATK